VIVYQETLKNFTEDVILNRITDKIQDLMKEKHLSGGSAGEVNAWNNSLRFMKDVLDAPEFPSDCSVAIEYNIPQTSKRVDFMVVGKDKEEKDHVVIVELKQWAKCNKIDDMSKHSIESDMKNDKIVAHPSYQAYSYKSLLLNYCDSLELDDNQLNPCAYLHNLGEEYRKDVEAELYSDWIEEAPVFLKSDVLKLRKFISQYINAKSSDGELLYKIDFGRIRPQKSLQDSLDSMLCGNEEFKMIDDQVVAFDVIMKAIKNAQNDNKKHVVIVSGGPGTGKSVLAINVLAKSIIDLGLNASYITKNMAPRKCYEKLLSKGDAKKAVNLKMAMKSPHALPFIPNNGIDVGIFDEAHRMQKLPYMYKGVDMLEDAIKASRVSIFFVDEDQRIAVDDCYNIDIIKEYATRLGAIIDTPEPFELSSQFRCNGSDGYIAFINNLLEIKETANKTFDLSNFEIKVFDDPNEMRNELREKNKINNKARMVAGYCYDWNVKNKRGEWDITLSNEFKAKWNLVNDDIWAINPESFEEVGCIHTCQGMEFDYVGVIIGKDLIYKDDKVCTDKWAISKDDRTSKIRSCYDEKLADRLIRNTYKVLLTRGQKGCYIYCEDKELSQYMKNILNKED